MLLSKNKMKKTLTYITAIVALAISVTACNTYSDEDIKSFNQVVQQVSKSQNTQYIKSESGLYYSIIEEGSGEYIKYTDVVAFNYVGKLQDGKIFDDRFKTETLKFEVSKLIEGWKEGLMYIKQGGKIKLIVPPYLGYGDHELKDIPKNSVLLFDIEVKEVI